MHIHQQLAAVARKKANAATHILDGVTLTGVHAWLPFPSLSGQVGEAIHRYREQSSNEESDFAVYSAGGYELLDSDGGDDVPTWVAGHSGSNAHGQTIYDQVGSLDVSQTSEGSQPLYVDSTPHALSFDGGDNLGSAGNIGISGDFTCDVLLVLTFAATAEGCALYFGVGSIHGAACGLFHGLRGNNVISIEFAGGRPAIFQTATQAKHLIRFRKTPGAINTTTSLWVDGSAHTIQGGSSTTTPNLTDSPIYIGSASPFTPLWSEKQHGVIAKFGGTFSDSEAALITNRWKAVEGIA